MSTDLSLERAIQALRTGDRETARALLHQLTQAEPLKPEGWLWLAAAQDDPLQKRVCLQQVLALDPGNQRAAAGLRALEQQQAGSTAAATAPAAPTEQAAAATNPARRLARPQFVSTGKRARRISWPIVALVGALIILIPLAIWLLGQTQSAQASASAWAILLVVEGGAIWPEIELVQPADDSLH
jgi:hypothetical protein